MDTLWDTLFQLESDAMAVSFAIIQNKRRTFYVPKYGKLTRDGTSPATVKFFVLVLRHLETLPRPARGIELNELYGKSCGHCIIGLVLS